MTTVPPPFHLATVLADDYPDLARAAARPHALPGLAPSSTPVAATWPEWLSADEEAVLAGLRFPARRRKWLLGRIAAKRVLGEALAGPGRPPPPPPAIVVYNLASGQPCARIGGRPLERSLSLSHRDPIGVAAVARPGLAIGVDVEEVVPRDPALVRTFFTAAEGAAVAGARGREVDLLVARTWSGKEAVLKALGLGLRRDPRTIEVGAEIDSTADTPPGWRPLAVRLVGVVATVSLVWREHDRYVLTLALIG